MTGPLLIDLGYSSGGRGSDVDLRVSNVIDVSAAAQTAAQAIAHPDRGGATAGEIDVRGGACHVPGLVITGTANVDVLFLDLATRNFHLTRAGDFHIQGGTVQTVDCDVSRAIAPD